jgi:hypothetical protein
MSSRQQHLTRILAALWPWLWLCLWLAACSPGHSGSAKIAFLRNGQLWTIYPDGSGAYEVAGGDPVIGYGWSPDHHLLVFRTLDSVFAASAQGRHLAGAALSGLIPDVPAGLNTVGVDGGTPIPIQFSSSLLRFSDAWWNPTGTRLLYRVTLSGSSAAPRWQLSQSDQPGGIASKLLPESQAIPSLSGTLILEMDPSGIFTVDYGGDHQQLLQRAPLASQPLSAALERVLWQPDHAQAAFLYAVATGQQASDHTPLVALRLYTPDGQTRTLTVCACRQFAWSSDGTHVLYTTGRSYSILRLDGSVALTFEAEANSVPSWSPDGRFLLLDGSHTLWLVDSATGQRWLLLSDRTPASESQEPAPLPSANALLQPVPNSPWAADSRELLFLTRGRLWWQRQQLSRGEGLYVVSLDSRGRPTGQPHYLTGGAITQAGWSYQNSNASFLF